MQQPWWQKLVMLPDRLNSSVNSLTVGHEQLMADQGQINNRPGFVQLHKQSDIRHLLLICRATETLILSVADTGYGQTHLVHTYLSFGPLTSYLILSF